MSTEKSNVAITRIRTGAGDDGSTTAGGKHYRKGHALIEYSASLDLAQGLTTGLPLVWGTSEPRSMMQELLFRLGAVVGSNKPKEQEIPLQEIGMYMEAQIDIIRSGLKPLDTFIRCSEVNAGFQQLRAMLRDAETKCIRARDQIEIESADVSPNLIHMLGKSSKALNIASDWVFAFVWAFSVDENGVVPSDLCWEPWSIERIAGLNIS